MHYLNSRYYDPEIGRFINADGFVSTGQGVLGYNTFAYCGNNPVNRVDPTGYIFSRVISGIKAGIRKINRAVSKVILMKNPPTLTHTGDNVSIYVNQATKRS